MTREEALQYGHLMFSLEEDKESAMCDFITTAIKALEQEPCKDAISRQAAINIVEDMHDLARSDVLSEAVKQLRDLPPVTPKDPCTDAISRQAVLDMLEDINAETEGVGFYYKHYVEYIKNLPPVMPQPKMGQWISLETQGEIDGQIVRAFTCSECGAISIFRMASGNVVNGDLCPNCRANMEEVKK